MSTLPTVLSVLACVVFATQSSGDGQQGRVAAALDDFHDAAAKADADRYFGRFTEDGVFLGTDVTERWNREEFRAWAKRFFERDSAWVYVPRSRHVSVAGDFAWFDEVLDNESYGTCRGTGTMRRVDRTWKIAHYSLTVPIPNPLLGSVAAQIREHELGRSADATTVFIVRHAEKELEGDDPELTDAGRARVAALERMLRSVEIDAVYATEFKRTRQTVQSIAAAASLEPTIVRAGKTAELVTRLKAHRGDDVLVAGHSNTVPGILRALGVADAPRLTEADYDNLFIVTLDPLRGARMTRVHFGK